MDRITFDEYSTNWDPDPMYNKAYVASVNKLVNDMYDVRGFVTLLEIYNLLGVPYTPEQGVILSMTSWRRDLDEPSIDVSNMVDIK